MVIEPRVVQFWSEIILVISNRTRAARSFNFGITRMNSAQIALHSVQLPLLIVSDNDGKGNCSVLYWNNWKLLKKILIPHDDLRKTLVQYLKENPEMVGFVWCL